MTAVTLTDALEAVRTARRPTCGALLDGPDVATCTRPAGHSGHHETDGAAPPDWRAVAEVLADAVEAHGDGWDGSETELSALRASVERLTAERDVARARAQHAEGLVLSIVECVREADDPDNITADYLVDRVARLLARAESVERRGPAEPPVTTHTHAYMRDPLAGACAVCGEGMFHRNHRRTA